MIFKSQSQWDKDSPRNNQCTVENLIIGTEIKNDEKINLWGGLAIVTQNQAMLLYQLPKDCIGCLGSL